MLIRHLVVENFRKFRGTVRLDGFGPGLNLVCEPNETGKSTILDAMRAALFERHSARTDRVRSFRPYGDELGPSVELGFEADGQSWTLQKRFLQSHRVSLSNGTQQFQSDEAEERLQTLLGFTRPTKQSTDEGTLGLLWVEQGAALQPLSPGNAVKRTISDLLAGEVGTVTGGRRTIAVTRALEAAMAELLTPKQGKPTGALLKALEAAEDAEAAFAAATTELASFEQVLGTLDARRSELRRIERELNDGSEQEQRTKWQADLDRARLLGEQLRSAALAEQAARGEKDRAAEQWQRRVEDRVALRRAEEALAARAAIAAAKAEDRTNAMDAEARYAEEVAEARTALDLAERTFEELRRTRSEAERRRAVAAAFERLDRTLSLRETITALEAELGANRLDAETLETLEALDRRLLKAQQAVIPQASILDITLLPSAPAVTVNGSPATREDRRPLTAVTEIVVADVGRFVFTPSAIAGAAELRAAQQDLDAALARLDQPDLPTARLAAHRRRDIISELKASRERLLAACPPDPVLKIVAGPEALQAALSQEERSDLPSEELTDLAAAEAAVSQARTEERAAVGRREAAAAVLRQAETIAAKTAGEQQSAETIRDHLARELTASTASIDDTALQDLAARAETEAARHLVELTAKQTAAAGLNVDDLERRLRKLDQRRLSLMNDKLELVRQIATLEEQAKTQGASGPASRVDAARDARDLAAEAAARLAEEAEILKLLNETIREAQLNATRRYLTPVTERIAPYLRRLFPDAAMTFSEEFAPSMITRLGRQERTGELSKGTQEQIAVLARLAFADLMIAKGKPASLILDDALVYSDDERFETMLDILTDAAERMQIIILTCRASAFRGLPATRLFLST